MFHKGGTGQLHYCMLLTDYVKTIVEPPFFTQRGCIYKDNFAENRGSTMSLLNKIINSIIAGSWNEKMPSTYFIIITQNIVNE